MKNLIIYGCFIWIFTACQSGSVLSTSGTTRVKKYDFVHPDIPSSFDGFRIVFASDFHYKSKFKEKQLVRMVHTVNNLGADLFLMGGDYQEGCEYVEELVSYLAQIQTNYGSLGVMGNNDYERCYEEIIEEMESHGIRILEHVNDTIHIGSEYIIISGVRNPFDLRANGISPTLELNSEDFVLLLTHTPDYTEDVDITHTDLALAGHTHGGQITFLGLYAPVTGSKYGQRFLKGKNKNTQGIPVITTKGLGTSRRNIRLFAHTEVILLILHSEEK